MKKIIPFLCLLAMSNLASAAGDTTSTEANKNVIIQYNSTPQQCKPEMKGPVNAGAVMETSPMGQVQTSGVGIRDCSGCRLDGNTNCVCASCINYFE